MHSLFALAVLSIGALVAVTTHAQEKAKTEDEPAPVESFSPAVEAFLRLAEIPLVSMSEPLATSEAVVAGKPFALAHVRKKSGAPHVTVKEGCFRLDSPSDGAIGDPGFTRAFYGTGTFRHQRIVVELLGPVLETVDGYVEENPLRATVVRSQRTALKEIGRLPGGAPLYAYQTSTRVVLVSTGGGLGTDPTVECPGRSFELERVGKRGVARRTPFLVAPRRHTWVSASVSSTLNNPGPLLSVTFSEVM